MSEKSKVRLIIFLDKEREWFQRAQMICPTTSKPRVTHFEKQAKTWKEFDRDPSQYFTMGKVVKKKQSKKSWLRFVDDPLKLTSHQVQMKWEEAQMNYKFFQHFLHNIIDKSNRDEVVKHI